jgi:hypothetical protein
MRCPPQQSLPGGLPIALAALLKRPQAVAQIGAEAILYHHISTVNINN